jgi:hypothetical protein
MRRGLRTAITAARGSTIKGCTTLLSESSFWGDEKFLFTGFPNRGERFAIIYSIIASCARHQVDALAYLRDVLTRLPAMNNRDDLGALLPARWKLIPAIARSVFTRALYTRHFW